MFVADLTEKRCFAPCDSETVKSGRCSCNNRISTSAFVFINFIRDRRIEKIKKILQ